MTLMASMELSFSWERQAGLNCQAHLAVPIGLHLLGGDGAIRVVVKKAENLAKNLFRSPVRHDVENDHELNEVDVAIIIRVVNSEHMLLHFRGVFGWECLAHHFSEVLW